MGLGMFSNLKLPQTQDTKLAPPPPTSVATNTTVRDGVQRQQVRLGKAAPRITVDQPEKSSNAKSLLGG